MRSQISDIFDTLDDEVGLQQLTNTRVAAAFRDYVRQVALVWPSEWSMMKFIFLVNRYSPLIDHFMLSLTCPVRELHVFGPYMNPDILFQVLKTTQPSTLSLQGFFLADLANTRFAKLLRQPCAVSLNQLELFVTVRSSDVDAARYLVRT